MNKLQHIDAFAQALARYRFSKQAQETLARTKLVLLTAPSAGGRNTIINKLLETNEYHYIVSDTTRQPRTNNGIPEQNGVEYWFRNEADVLKDVQEGNFLEAEIIHGQQVSGISMRELQRASEEHKIAITDVDIGGIEAVSKSKPDTIAILILPPSFAEWQRRLDERGEMPADELHRRLETAARIFEAGINADYMHLVINDSLEQAIDEVHELSTTGAYDPKKTLEAHAILRDLYQQTKMYLKEV